MAVKVYSTVDVDRKLAQCSTKRFLQMAEKITIDLSFQSRARWSMSQKQSFINSCLIDLNINKFIIVDIKRCRDNCEEGTEDWKYYDGWYQLDVGSLNVDSNNRTETLKEFKAGEIKIPHGDYYIRTIGRTFKVRKDNDTWKTMDDDFKLVFLGNSVSTHIITCATREQLSDVFERMNNGESLNKEEKLNCAFSATCRGIRDLADEFHPSFLKSNGGFFSDVEINRRKIDGWFANMFYLYQNGIDQQFTVKPHREMYDSESVSNKMIKQFKTDWSVYIKMVGKKIKLFHYKWVYADLFMMIREQKELGKRLKDKSTIVQDFIDMVTPVMASKEAKYTFDGIEFIMFAKLCRGEGGNTPKRMGAYKMAGWDITKYFTGVLDPKIGLDKIEKQSVAVRDDWKDSDGDEFTPETLFDGDFDGGHILARGMEGRTTPENTVIEKMSPNRSKKMQTTVVSETANA